MKHALIIFSFILFPLMSFCVTNEPLKKCNETFTQWFTGPLFTPMAITQPKNQPALEVTTGFKNQYGIYGENWSIKYSSNLWSIFNYYDVQLGISSILGMEIIASWTANFRKNVSSVHLQDTTVRIGFQICNEIPDTWVPDFRIIFQEVFPTGKYNNLNPLKCATDLTGLGSYQTGIYLAFQKLFKLYNRHKYQMRFSAGYFVPSKVNVEGFNAYGGGYGTQGKIYPGSYISIYCSGEYNFNGCWAVAFDSNFQYNFKGRFSGKNGHMANGIKATISSPEAVTFTIAPELEHTFTESTGMLLGAWFSVFGKNSPSFLSMFLAIVHVF